MVNTINGLTPYEALKCQILALNISPIDLNNLKHNSFQAKIASKRRLDCIRTLSDLLDCLERRDIISEDNVEALHCFGDTQIQTLLSNYAPPAECSNNRGLNQYQQERLSEELRQKAKLSNSISAPYYMVPAMRSACIVRDTASSSAKTTGSSAFSHASSYPQSFSEDKRAAIYKLLSQELGRDWRKFGRELEIRESAMDEIELVFPTDLSSRIYKLMQLFEEDECHDPKQNVLIICRALGECRRKDLRRKVENIMSY